MKIAALFALAIVGSVAACDDEIIPPKVAQKQAVKEASPAERRDAACKAKSLPSPEAVKTGEGAAELPSGNVARIEIDGSSDDAKARGMIGIAVGDAVTLSKTQDAMRKLYAFGDVDDVRLDARPTPQGVVLHFHVERRAKLGEIVLHGGTVYDAPELEKALHASAGSIYDPVAMTASRATLVEALHARGYSDAALTVTGERNPDGVVDICVDLHEGQKITIESVKFTGLGRIKETELSTTLDTDHGRINAPGGVIDQTKIDEAVAKMAEAFDARGLAKGTISTKTMRNGDKVALIFEIEEGPVVTMRRYDVKGDLIGDASAYRSLMSMKSRDVFSRAKLVADLKKIGDMHEKKGHADLVVEPQTQLDDKNNTVDVVLVVIDPKKLKQQTPPPPPSKK